jgi:signal peptidase I
MGDNRHFSKDSRYSDVGFIPKENLVGKAQIIFFSINGSFLEFWKWFTEIRFERIFKPIR